MVPDDGTVMQVRQPDVDLITWFVPLTHLSFSSCLCIINMAGVGYYLRL